MAVLSFLIEPLANHDSVLTLTPVVDGTPLTALVEAFESEHGLTPAGGYGGLVPEFFKYGPLDRYFMGEPEGALWKDGQYLLGCSCGEVGCWPLEAKIQREGETIVWKEFAQPHRPARDYSVFGPFVFDLKQYSEKLAEMVQRLAVT